MSRKEEVTKRFRAMGYQVGDDPVYPAIRVWLHTDGGFIVTQMVDLTEINQIVDIDIIIEQVIRSINRMIVKEL